MLQASRVTAISRTNPRPTNRPQPPPTSSQVRTEVLQELPAIVEGGDDDATASPYAAAEGSLEDAAAVEEEFDLSDILSEEVGFGFGRFIMEPSVDRLFFTCALL